MEPDCLFSCSWTHLAPILINKNKTSLNMLEKLKYVRAIRNIWGEDKAIIREKFCERKFIRGGFSPKLSTVTMTQFYVKTTS